MHKFAFGLLAALLIATPSLAAHHETGEAADPHAADKAAIRDMYARWDTAVEAGSLEGYKAILDENVQLVLPGAPNKVGRENYAAFLSTVLPLASYDLTDMGEMEFVFMGDDYALVQYHKHIVLTLKDADNAIATPGAVSANISHNKYTDVLKRQADGSWKVFRHVWTDSSLRLPDEE